MAKVGEAASLPRLAPAAGHGLVPSIVAVAADQDLDPRPAGPDRPPHMAQHQRQFRTIRRPARPQDDGDRHAVRGFIDVDRQDAAAVVMGMEQRQLLVTGHAIRGVVDVRHDASRRLIEAGAGQLDHGRQHPLERGRPWQVLAPAHGRLRAQIAAALRQPADRQLEGRSGAQGVAFVGIGIAGSDPQRPEADHLGEAVAHPLRIAPVRETAGGTLGDSQLALDLRQQQDSGIRGQPPAVEGDTRRPAGNR